MYYGIFCSLTPCLYWRGAIFYIGENRPFLHGIVPLGFRLFLSCSLQIHRLVLLLAEAYQQTKVVSGGGRLDKKIFTGLCWYFLSWKCTPKGKDSSTRAYCITLCTYFMIIVIIINNIITWNITSAERSEHDWYKTKLSSISFPRSLSTTKVLWKRQKG